MKNNSAITVEHVSKKYCKGLKRSMLYGIQDIGRNSLGLSSRSGTLRKNEFWALKDASFEVKKGETLGIIGPNGSGKTTLLKMLNGIFWPDKGKITVRGRVSALIAVGAGFHPMLTGRDNIYINAAILGMTKLEVDEKFDEIVAFADIGSFLDMPVKFYSSGMFVRLGFAVAVHCRPEILLVDEVLAVGDLGFQKKCYDKIGDIRKNGTTTLLVAHNMHIISAFTENLIFLNKGILHYFNDVAKGIQEYTDIFLDKSDSGIEKVATGNETIRFSNIEINKRVFHPGEFFSISMQYATSKDYNDLEIDVVIYSGNESKVYFQASNKAFQKTVHLKKGGGSLTLDIENIPINNNFAKICIAIWTRGRREKLFWWRIPVEFKGVPYASGSNFLNVRYDFK
jgi:lipopolysaccharide transport system ATP-binding protein